MTKDSQNVFHLTGKNLEISLSTIGASIISLRVPDKTGKVENVVLSYPDIDTYRTNPSYLGTIAGRYANRIADGRFTIDGQGFQLQLNENETTCLHGGVDGFHRAIWQCEEHTEGGITFTHTSPDGDQGFPGNLTASVKYTVLKNGDGIQIDYVAVSDKPTIVNLTNHSYFNLYGLEDQTESCPDILDHVLSLAASRYTPVDHRLIPTGEIVTVPDAFDIQGRTLKEVIATTGGLDHNFVIDRTSAGMTFAARLQCASKGRVLEVFTDMPGVQVYTANHMNKTELGSCGLLPQHAGICLETQNFPDAPNHGNFPSAVLRPGERYESTTIFKFSVMN